MQKLNVDDLPDEILELIGQLDSRVVGQERAVITLARAIMRFRAGVDKFAALIAKKALKDGDRVTVDIEEDGGLQFLRLPGPQPLLLPAKPSPVPEQEKAAA